MSPATNTSEARASLAEGQGMAGGICFDSPEKVAALKAIASSWIGTPFVPNGSTKQGGVSCQKLVGEIYREAGVIGSGFDIPSGEMNWAHAQTESLIERFMDSQGAFASVGQWRPGDMVGFSFGGCVHHCGLVVDCDGTFIHCLRGRGAAFANLNDASFMRRLKRIWRPL